MVAQDHNTNQKEVQDMPAKKLSKAQSIAAEKLEREKQIDAHYAAVPVVLAPSALDAILATPIAGAVVHKHPAVDMAAMVTAGQEAMVEQMAMVVEPAYSLACDPLYVQLAQIVVSLQNKVDGLEAYVRTLSRTPEPVPVKDPDISGHPW